ncbi:DUF4430 domain-containing protein [Bacillus sp. CGMCC 1.16607]|uniref:DUF4430 domain-containing protein n=1 Tax=Bacillus sp. CGMCC 1.16607 TaxID=3351842 RepID=UPI003640E3B1
MGRIWNIAVVFGLVFALFAGSFQTTSFAAEAGKESITVVGTDETEVLLSETEINPDGKSTALQTLINAVGSGNVEISESTYGKMITGIKGLKAKDNFFWAFYINGVSAQVGADQYIVKKGDQISFHYVDWKAAPLKAATLKVISNTGLMKEATDIAFENEPTAFQLLQVVLGDKVKYTESQYGKMITSIDGLEGKDTYYWAFYVNGQIATVGADSYKLKAGDQISFQYESWEKPGEETEELPKEDTSKPISEPISSEKMQKSIDLASQYVVKNQVGEWEAIALKQAGKELSKNYLENIKKVIKDRNGRFSKITDYERYTLGIVAAGGDPSNIAGYNLIENIYNGEVTKQGLNGVLYALIALDSANFEIPKTAKWSREKLINYLLEKQNKDGGWSWDGSATSDIDTTAMVLTSLAPYINQENVKFKMDTTVNYLSKQYASAKINNSSTAAQVIIALSAAGIDANGDLFANKEASLMTYLLTFQNKDGGFDWQGGDVSDVMSTSQAIQGIVSYQLFLNNNGSLYQISQSPVSSSKVDDNSEISNPINKVVEGKLLPNTATNTYNLFVFGLILLLLGAILFMIEKRKKA